MAKIRQLQKLYVNMNGIRVGMLLRESNGNLVFSYDPHWLTLESSRPISLSMPLTEIPYRGNLVDSFFDNLLPDNEIIRKRIQSRFSIRSNNCFDLLSSIGADCVGAIQLLTQEKEPNIKTIQATPITPTDIAKLLKNYQTAPLGMDRNLDFRISIAGAQEKTALLRYQDKWCLPKGPTPTSHIIKLPIGHITHANIDLSESVENEWICLKILSLYNIPVNEASIGFFDDVKTLIIKRFDRVWSENGKWLIRVPQEDMCQALGFPPGLKYESDGGPGIRDIMNVLLGSNAAIEDRYIFMKTIFLFWVLGAIDGHAKNFSISIGPKGRYQLTPIYDVISAYPIAEKQQLEWKDLKMAMSLKSKNTHYHWSTLLPRHWLAMADTCKFSSTIMQSIMDEIFDKMEEIINKTSMELPNNFPQHISLAIFEGMRKIKNRCNSHKQ